MSWSRSMDPFEESPRPYPPPPPNSPTHGVPPSDHISANTLSRALIDNFGGYHRSSTANGLIQAVEATGRVRGSSATPVQVAAQVHHPSQPQREEINNFNYNHNLSSAFEAATVDHRQNDFSQQNGGRQQDQITPQIGHGMQSNFNQDHSYGHNVHSQNAIGQNVIGQNVIGQNVHGQNVHGHNVHGHNVHGQNVYNHQSNLGQQNTAGQRDTIAWHSAPAGHPGISQQNIISQQGNSLLQRAVEQNHQYLQQQLFNMSNFLTRMPHLTSDVATELVRELYRISEGYKVRSRQLHSDFSRQEIEHKRLVGSLAELQRIVTKNSQDSRETLRKLGDVLAHRDRACTERDTLERQLKELNSNKSLLEQRLSELERRHSVTVDGLRQELLFKDEQLKGKRSLWMSKHPDSSGRPGTVPRDPYSTPSGHHRTRFGSESSADLSASKNLLKKFEQLQMASDPSKANFMPSNLPFVQAFSSHHLWCSDPLSGSAPGSRANCGSDVTIVDSPSMALIPFRSEEETAETFRTGFDKVYNLVHKWTHTYTHHVNDISFDKAISREEEIWQFMLKCTFEVQTEAQNHVILLLRDTISRPYLVMRMIIQFLYESIWTLDVFETSDETCRQNLEHIKLRLATRGLSPEERAEVIGLQSRTIQRAVQQDKHSTSRRDVLSKQGKALRNIVGPLLNSDAKRADAGTDLTAVVVAAFDLSLKMFTSNKTFIIKFPECGTKFLRTSMICREPFQDDTPLQLQIRQARVKLSVTPLITMRDDRFLTIQVKDVQQANVLVMA